MLGIAQQVPARHLPDGQRPCISAVGVGPAQVPALWELHFRQVSIVEHGVVGEIIRIPKAGSSHGGQQAGGTEGYTRW